MEFKHRAVILGTDNPASLAIIRNLGRRKIHITTMDGDPSPYGVSKYTKDALIVPSCRDEGQLLKTLVDYAASLEKKPVLFAATKDYRRFFDRHIEELEPYYLFPMKKSAASTLSHDQTIHQLAESAGILVPERVNLTDGELLRQVPLLLGYPCLLKCSDPRFFKETFGENFILIKNESALLDKLHAMEHHGCNHKCFLEAMIQGPEDHEYTANLYYGKDSELKGFLTSETIRKYPLPFGKTGYSKQKWIPELVNLVDPLFKKIGYRGVVETQWKRDEFSRKVYLLSVKPRFSESTEMFCHLGFETPYMYYLDALDLDIPVHFIDRDTHCHWKNKQRDLFAIYNYIKNDQMNLVKIISDYKFRKTNSAWAWDDMGPGLSYFGYATEKRLSELWQKRPKFNKK